MEDEQQVWSVSWIPALTPIPGIIPDENVFSHLSSADTLTAAAENLFGLPFCSAQTAWDEVLSGIQTRSDEEEQSDQEEPIVSYEIEDFLAFI